MTCNQGTPAAANVVSLFDDEDFAENHQAARDASTLDVLESMMANPRFTAPANDEPDLSNLVKLAPQDSECRQAQLLCLWAEILMDHEIA